MTGTVVPNLTDISMCESTTGWSNLGGGTQSINDITVFDAKEGTYCLQDYKASASTRGSEYDLGSNQDFSDVIVIMWFAFSKIYNATTPMRIRITDGDGDYAEWNIFTKDTLSHCGWIAWALKPSVTPDTESGTFDITIARKVGWIVDGVLSKTYIYWDAVRYGYGLTIKGGTSGDPAKFEDFITSEATYAYGIVEKYNGVYYLQGQPKIGSLTNGEDTYFKDPNQIVQFKEMKGNPTGFYEIKGQGNATGETKIFLGEKSGSVGISGCFIRAPSAMKWKLTMSDTNITEFGFYCCILVNADTIIGQAYSTVKEFLSTNFIACAEVLPSTGIMKYCKFISSPGEAVRIDSTSHNITNCDFITCAIGVHITVNGPFTFNALSFSGCTYDGKNTYGSSVTVNYDQYCSPAPSTYDPAGDEIVYQAAVTLIVRHVKTGNEPTEYVRCSIYRKSDMYEIMNKDADVADEQTSGYYKASTSYTQTGITVIIRARESGYLPFEMETTIASSGLDITAIWILDPNYTP